MHTFSSYIILSCLFALAVPAILTSSSFHDSTLSHRRIYIIFTQAASVVLSLRLAGGDSARYSDLYFLCSVRDTRLVASFWDPFSHFLCYFCSVSQTYRPFLFLQFYVPFASLFVLPLCIRKANFCLTTSFYRYYPLVCSLTVVLGYFTSPVRQATASALIAFGLLSCSPLLLCFSFLFHWSAPLMCLMYFLITYDFAGQFGMLFKRFTVRPSLFYLIASILILVLILSQFSDVLLRLSSYASLLFQAIGNFSLAGGLGSISSFKFLLILFSIPVLLYVIHRLDIPSRHRSYIIVSFALYPFSELARLSLPAVIILSYYLASGLTAIPIRPQKFLVLPIIVAIYFKSANAFNVDAIGSQSGWIESTYFRGYNNAYDLDKFYGDHGY